MFSEYQTIVGVWWDTVCCGQDGWNIKVLISLSCNTNDYCSLLQNWFSSQLPYYTVLVLDLLFLFGDRQCSIRISHNPKLCAIEITFIPLILVHHLVSISGIVSSSFLESSTDNLVDEDSPDQAEDDGAGEQEVEDGDFESADVERKYWVVGVLVRSRKILVCKLLNKIWSSPWI